MKKICLSILSGLATLACFTSLACCAEPQFPTASAPDPSRAPVAVVSLTPASGGNSDLFLVNLMINLADREIEYDLNESTTIFMACTPFAEQQSGTRIARPLSNFSVGLKVTF